VVSGKAKRGDLSEVFAVKCLLASKLVGKAKTPFYLVQWEDYSEKHNSWESSVNISDALRQAFHHNQQSSTLKSKLKNGAVCGPATSSLKISPLQKNSSSPALLAPISGDVSTLPKLVGAAQAADALAPDAPITPVVSTATCAQNELSDYDKQRQERIRENNAMMAKFGLSQAAKNLNKWVAKPEALKTVAGAARQKRRLAAHATRPVEPRRSERQRTVHATATSYVNFFGAAGRQLDEATGQLAAAAKRRKLNSTSQSSRIVRPELSEEQRADLGLANLDLGWLQGLENFLKDTELHTYWFGRAASETNVARVMAQVRKLASGDGVPHPCASAVFMQGRPLTLGDDIRMLVEEAWQWLDVHGEDKGHGWLLNHPLKKVLAFQQHMVDNLAAT
jgi:hypothetical protein